MVEVEGGGAVQPEAHPAAIRLPPDGSDRTAQIESFRRFLKLETERLRIRHRLGMGGVEIAVGRSALVDLVIGRMCQLAAAELDPADSMEVAQSAVVALGGYGRRELAPCSDIDLMFLHPPRPGKTAKAFAEHVLYLLWDIGLTVGHSFRSIPDCLSWARKDLHSRTAMSEARLITGQEGLFRRLTRELDEAIYGNAKETDAFLLAMRAEQGARYEKFGRAVGLQEPNVKESAGGLRDLHTVLWAGRARYGCHTIDELRAQGVISVAECTTARRAYDFLYRVRNEAHFVTGRRTDLLSLDVQAVVAANLGFQPKRGFAPSEVFMREYYRRAHELHGFCESFLTRVGGADKPRWRFRLREKVARRGAFEIRGGALHPRGEGGGLVLGARHLLEAFTIAQAEGVGLSDKLRLVVRGHLPLVARRFRSSRETGKAFLAILGRPGMVGGTLRAMHDTGLLGRLLPEFARITFLVQHDLYHRYTIDEHTLAAIDALDEVARSRDVSLQRFKKAMQEIQEPTSLYLGMLLHDIGKGLGGGHAQKGTRMAQRVCSRLGLPERSAGDVLFLVENHLLMSHLSQRRDIAEPALVDGFAATVGTVDRLNLLLLLTYADHRGVGPGVWTEWKGTLLFDLYDDTRRRLTGARGRRGVDPMTEARHLIVEQLASEVARSEVERHLAMLPARYIRTTDVDAVARHLRLIARLGDHRLVADWRLGAERHTTDLTICARDRTGLFAAMAGTLTGHGINILSVDVYTREDGFVLDTFKLSDSVSGGPVASERWGEIELSLRAAVAGEHDVAAAVEKWRARAPRHPRRRPGERLLAPSVRFDGVTSAERTVVEVRAEDELGLLYRIASTLAGLGLDIHFAKIATEKAHALDVFYVTDSDGEKLLPERMSEVEERLVEVLGSPVRKAAPAPMD